MNPEETRKQYGVESIHRANFPGILHAISHCDILLSGGGSLLQDITSTRSIMYFLSIISIAKRMGKKVVLYAKGIGPIHKKANRNLVHQIINQVDLITLRDEDSYRELKDLQIDRPQVLITADPVFTIEGVACTATKEDLPEEKKIVGISLRKWKNLKYEKIVADFADYIHEKYNFDVVFIPTQGSQDLEINEKVRKLMKNPSALLQKQRTVEDWVNLIGKMHILVSMRLHPLIFAAMQCIPMIGLSYDDSKVDSFLKMVDQPSAGNVVNLDLEQLCSIFDDTVRNHDDITASLGKIAEQLRGRAQENDKLVVTMLDDLAKPTGTEK